MEEITIMMVVYTHSKGNFLKTLLSSATISTLFVLTLKKSYKYISQFCSVTLRRLIRGYDNFSWLQSRPRLCSCMQTENKRELRLYEYANINCAKRNLCRPLRKLAAKLMFGELLLG